MPSKRYWSAQMMRQFKPAPFIETMSKEHQSNVMTLSLTSRKFKTLHQCSHNVVKTLYAFWVKRREKKIVVRCLIISCMPFVQASFVLGE